MTLQNRVQPDGAILALPARGTLMGNRGCLHGPDRTLGRARWRHPHWISCELSFRGRHRVVMSAGRYTELFFLDECVALAAGHRPCAECRRPAYATFREAWGRAFGSCPRAGEVDRILHCARVGPDRRQQSHRAEAEHLPDGTFLRLDGQPRVLRGPHALRYAPGGYAGVAPRPRGPVEVMTPAPLVAVLAAGYAPQWHASAGALSGEFAN